jgi:acetyl esterase/lipase
VTVEDAISRVQAVYGGWSRQTSVEQMRADWDALFASETPSDTPSDTPPAEEIPAAGLPATWFHPPNSRRDRVMLYLHGGGFKLGSVRSHRAMIVRLAAAAGCAALALDYRLAPEHKFPAPVEDTVDAYYWLLDQGFAPEHIVFAGDSAGGGLALSTMVSLRNQATALPAAGAVMSAWTDLTASGASYETRAAADPIHQRGMILATAKSYLGGTDAKNPLASPLFADLQGLPPLLMQVGGRETVLDDTLDFAAKAKQAGVAVDVSVYEKMIHVFQQFAPDLAEANQAIAEIAAFLERIWV